jgi:hypothetical protein
MSSYKRKLRLRLGPVYDDLTSTNLIVQYQGDSYCPRVCLRCDSTYYEPLPLQPYTELCPWCRGETTASAQDHLTAEIEAAA